jgi:gamma-glutamyltranspeptidase/glutathione hydrolase
VLARNVVTTSQPLATQAGLEMLRQGGNAVDAALGAAITLTVVEPTANGVGGDAFAMVWDGRKLHGLNGSGRSPAEWSPAYFARYDKMPETGWDTVTVPGAVDAWFTLSQRFGRLPFERLFEPAVRHAEQGFMVSPIVSAFWAEAAPRFSEFAEFSATFLPKGRPPLAGERFSIPQLADTLKKIATGGAETFYRGEIAAKIAACAAEAGAALTAEDLAGHRSEWVEPLRQEYHGIHLYELPPNGQGLAALMALGILRHHELRDYPPDSTESVHLQVEAMKIALATCMGHIADPSAMGISPRSFLSDGFLFECARGIRMDRASQPQCLRPAEGGTVCLSTADETGLMVSYIQSNYLGFGSGIIVPGTGIALQNRGRGFSLQNGHPNRVAGCKRPFHTIIPGFATRDDLPMLSFGVMGALMQPQGHVQMVTRIVDQGLNPQAASDAPRWCVTEDFRVALEPSLAARTAVQLSRCGHQLVTNPPVGLFGGAQLVARLPDGYCAASDHRKDGQAAGF